ncbi:MAG: IclR family transcriptional regulator [Rhizobiaceae bacterium]|nr:IclR family transcriptional regulator [Rhizobiaceae bacterium]
MRKRARKEEGNEADAQGVSTSLVRGLAILRSFGPGDHSLGNLELMERTGLPKATVSRLTFTLARLGYLDYDERLGRYSLGSATVSLGYSALSANPVIAVAPPLMRGLAEATGAAVALGTRDGLEMLYLANCRSESLVTLRLNVGSRVPLWNSGMGLAYLVGLSRDDREGLLEQLRTSFPEHATRIVSLVEAALEQFARLGYVTAFGTWHGHVRAVGVPFRPRDGSPPMAITCGGIADIIDEPIAREVIGPGLVALAALLAETLEGRASAPVWGEA